MAPGRWVPALFCALALALLGHKSEPWAEGAPLFRSAKIQGDVVDDWCAGTVDSGLNTSVHVLSWSPRVVLVKRFVDPKDVEVFVNTASPKMKMSGLGLRPGEEFDSTIRTSTGAFVSREEDPTGTIARVEESLANLVGIPVPMGEAWNVLHYPLNGHYAHHYDYFDPEVFKDQAENPRLATFLLYLRSPEGGGETIFPKSKVKNGYKGGEVIQSFDTCDRGLKVRAMPGDGVFFYSQTPDLTLDTSSLHGGCPVDKGEKWVATKWMHNLEFEHKYEPLKTAKCTKFTIDSSIQPVEKVY